ncbi:hypothetical protein I7I50_09981 [Histoplasma capsulatum G186AR]|uniref:Uncharacterized protein n=1 Tax=Ajellomyces capsulatus TaxID=5037 RepID=A0A8H8D747_AJECA|nr:hypothetical protein I7I52_01219 [Histoplasma capsulatum]QSS68870.1 hypothetical protein I7I50_09981 [Histoplasma capsulatum G186AR]
MRPVAGSAVSCSLIASLADFLIQMNGGVTRRHHVWLAFLESDKLQLKLLFQDSRESVEGSQCITFTGWPFVVPTYNRHVAVWRRGPHAHHGFQCCLLELLLYREQVCFYVNSHSGGASTCG